MLLSKLTHARGFKRFAAIAATFLLLVLVFAPVANVLGTPVVAVAHAQDDGFCSGKSFTASTCLSSVVYLFAVYLPTNFAYAAGYLFNFALQLGLNSGAYALNFLSQGWSIVRDIANLSFIFLLIYIAYTIIMQAETAGTLKTLAWVVVMALLINFSFFMTRIVIDAGNILSVQFYNAIPISSSMPSPLGGNNNQYVKDMTSGVMNAVQIQGILSDTSFKAFTGTGNSSAPSGFTAFLKNLGVLILVFVAVGILLSLLGFVFLVVGIKFIIRIIVLWIAIIASPLAFAAHALPGNKQVMGYYKLWEKHLIESSFYPAVFLFMFFIFTLFMNAMAGQQGIVPQIFAAGTNLINPAGTTNNLTVNGVIAVIANVGIRVGLIVVMLFYAMKFSDSFSEEGSGAARSIISWTSGKAANVAAGTSGWAARNTAGRGANALARTDLVKNWATSNPLYGGRLVAKGLRNVADSNLDVRGAPGLKSVANKAGIKLNNAPKTSFNKAQEARAKDLEKQAKAVKSDVVDIAKAQAETDNFKRNHAGGEKGFAEAKKSLEVLKLTHEGLLAEAKNNEEKAAAKKDLDRITKDLQQYDSGKDKMKRLDNERLERLAQHSENRELHNMWWPSRGDIEGTSRIRKVMKGEADPKEALKHLGHAMGMHVDEPAAEKPAEEKTGEDTKPTEKKNSHEPEHLLRNDIKIQTRGNSKIAADYTLNEIAERLAKSDRLNGERLEEIKNKIDNNSEQFALNQGQNGRGTRKSTTNNGNSAGITWDEVIDNKKQNPPPKDNLTS